LHGARRPRDRRDAPGAPRARCSVLRATEPRPLPTRRRPCRAPYAFQPLKPLYNRDPLGSERQIRVGNVAIGGGAPVVVQSMTLTMTHDVEATTAQIAALASAGCEVVRCAVPKTEDAEALRMIVRLSPIPVVADIHFN